MWNDVGRIKVMSDRSKDLTKSPTSTGGQQVEEPMQKGRRERMKESP
jgi:hypothetical protein